MVQRPPAKHLKFIKNIARASSCRMAWNFTLCKPPFMLKRIEHLNEAERLERQAEIADNKQARAALRRMAQASRGVAALVGMIEASREETARPG